MEGDNLVKKNIQVNPPEDSENEIDMFEEMDQNIEDVIFSQWYYEMREDQKETSKSQCTIGKSVQSVKNTDIISGASSKSSSTDIISSSNVQTIGQAHVKLANEPRELNSSHKFVEQLDKNQGNVKSQSILQSLDDAILSEEFSEEITLHDLKITSNTPKDIVLAKIKEKTSIASGFSTARGNKIRISDDKLRKVGKIFKDVENIDSVLESIERNVIDVLPENVPVSEEQNVTKSTAQSESLIPYKGENIPSGFATASGKDIYISEQKLSRAKKIYNETELDLNSSQCHRRLIDKENKRITIQQNNIPLKVSNKKVSNYELNTNYKNLQEIPVPKKIIRHQSSNTLSRIQNIIQPNSIVREGNKKVTEVSEFSLAAGKGIQMNHVIMDKVERIFKNIRGIENAEFGESSSSSFKGEEKVNLEERFDLKKKFNLANELDSEERINLDVNSESVEKYDSRELFSEVKVMEDRPETSECLFTIENLKRCQLFSETLNPGIVKTGNIDEMIKTGSTSVVTSSGFSTASGKSLSISRENQIKVKRMYEDEDLSFISSGKIDLYTSSNYCQNEDKSQIEDKECFQASSSVKSDLRSENQDLHNIQDKFQSEIQNNQEPNDRNDHRKLNLDNDFINNKSLNQESLDFPGFNYFSDFRASDCIFVRHQTFFGELESILNEGMIDRHVMGRSITDKEIERQDEDGLWKEKEFPNSQDVLVSTSSLGQEKTVILVNHSQESTLKRKMKNVNYVRRLERYEEFEAKKQKLDPDLQSVMNSFRNAQSDFKQLTHDSNQHETSLSDDNHEEITDVNRQRTVNFNNVKISNSASSDFIDRVKIMSQEGDVLSSSTINYNLEIDRERKENMEDVRRSPILGITKRDLKRKRRSRTFKSIDNESRNSHTDSLPDIVQQRDSAASKQENWIIEKRDENLKPIPGSLLRIREESRGSRISLRQYAGGSTPKPRSLEEIRVMGIDPEILRLTSSTAAKYRFKIVNDEKIADGDRVSLEIEDGTILIPDEDGYAGVEQFEKAFRAMPGVDPSLIPSGWIKNHYRWIVWKLASMDRMDFGFVQPSRFLTPERVMKDLKYRYDREIDRSQRSAIRKILEKDEIPSKRIVLCISSISEMSELEMEEKDPRILLRTPRWRIEVTDGWYSLPVSFDTAMIKHIVNGKIKEGTKIVTYNAELLNCDKGCSPLQELAYVYLKIHTNCTRRVRWDTKLGFQAQTGPIPVNLRNIDPDGGLVGRVTVTISRIYPTMYREKTIDGKSIYRNAKDEEKAAMAHEQELQVKAEAAYAEAEKELEERRHDFSQEDSAESLTNCDHSNIHQARLMKLKERVESQLREILPQPRNVIPVDKVRIIERETSAILSIWARSEEVSFLKEGNSLSIFNLNVHGRRDEFLHLTTNHQTIFKYLPNLKENYPSRVYTSLEDVTMPDFEPPYAEFDTVGVVSWIGSAPHEMKNFEAIGLSYPKNDSEFSTLIILFWRGISSFGFSSILTEGSIVACMNLETRRSRTALSSFPLGYCSERTVFTQNPRNTYLLDPLNTLKAQIKDPHAFANKCSENIMVQFQNKAISKQLNSGSLNSTPISLRTKSLVVKEPLDEDTSAKSPAIQKRLEKLALYGEAPRLSPVTFINSSNVRSNFRPVIRSSLNPMYPTDKSK